MEEEIWKPVVGFEGLYEVSNLGNVRSLHSRTCGKRGGLMKQSPMTGGYARVTLTKGGKEYSRKVARLVMEAFVGPRPTPNHDINHIKGDKMNSRLDNLEYCTKSYNQRHKFATGLYVSPKGDEHWKTKVPDRMVEVAAQMAAEGREHKDIAALLGIKERSVGTLLRDRAGMEPEGSRFGLRFTKEDVQAIKSKVESGVLVGDVAKEYEVSHSAISSIINGRSYAYFGE